MGDGSLTNKPAEVERDVRAPAWAKGYRLEDLRRITTSFDRHDKVSATRPARPLRAVGLISPEARLVADDMRTLSDNNDFQIGGLPPRCAGAVPGSVQGWNLRRRRPVVASAGRSLVRERYLPDSESGSDHRANPRNRHRAVALKIVAPGSSDGLSWAGVGAVSWMIVNAWTIFAGVTRNSRSPAARLAGMGAGTSARSPEPRWGAMINTARRVLIGLPVGALPR